MIVSVILYEFKFYIFYFLVFGDFMCILSGFFMVIDFNVLYMYVILVYIINVYINNVVFYIIYY